MTLKAPWFKFFPADFMNGVRGMSAQEIGLYTMILCRIYEESGPVDHNPLRLATYCGMRAATFTKTLEKLIALGKLTLSDGMISNSRAEIEIENRSHHLELASRAGKASARKRLEYQRSASAADERKSNQSEADTDLDKKDDDDRAHEPDGLMSEVCEAAGTEFGALLPQGGRFGMSPRDTEALRRWQDELGLTREQILASVTEQASRMRSPVRSINYFTPGMRQLSAELLAPPLQPIQTVHSPRQTRAPGGHGIQAQIPEEYLK